MADFMVVDGDSHIQEKREDLLKYLDEPFRRRYAWPDRPWLFFPRNTWDFSLGGRFGRLDSSAAEFLRLMDEAWVEQVVLYPSMGLAASFVQEPEMAVALCRAYNGFVHAEYRKASPRLHPMALLPIQDIPEAARELRRGVVELGMPGGVLPAHTTPGYPLLGDPYYSPIYEEAERLQCVLALHTGASLTGGPEIDPFKRMIEAHTVLHPFSQMRQLTSLIFSGVLERFPRIRFACLEAGAGWAPYFVERVDAEYEKRGAVEAPALSGPPSRFFRNGQVYVHCEAGEAILPYVLAYLGEDHLIYSGDYPHWDNEFPQNIKVLKDRADISETAKRKILRENARRLYRLG